MPQNAAGWRIEPPVSDPSDAGTSPAATAAAEPPLDPPGTRSSAQGLQVFSYAEFSVEEHMANSSMFVLPMMTAPARLRRSTQVASYVGTKPIRIREPQVVGTVLVHRTSLMAIGMPARGPGVRPSRRSRS